LNASTRIGDPALSDSFPGDSRSSALSQLRVYSSLRSFKVETRQTADHAQARRSKDVFETETVDANWALKPGGRLSHRPVARAVTVEALAVPARTLLHFTPFQLFRAFFLQRPNPFQRRSVGKGERWRIAKRQTSAVRDAPVGFVWKSCLFCDLKDFDFLHLEIVRTRENRAPAQSGVVGVNVAKGSEKRIGLNGTRIGRSFRGGRYQPVCDSSGKSTRTPTFKSMSRLSEMGGIRSLLRRRFSSRPKYLGHARSRQIAGKGPLSLLESTQNRREGIHSHQGSEGGTDTTDARNAFNVVPFQRSEVS
jgi:hypothetical protein